MTEIVWNSPDAPPETPQGDCRAVLITVEVSGAKRYCVPAFYLNGMSLVSQAYECLAGLTDDECEAQHMDGCPVTGFYEASPFEGEPDGMYSKPYGEVIAWAAFPEPCAALSDNEREEKQ